jgi:hypothetical protein
MRMAVETCALVLIGTVANAAELPARKPGLWEIKMSFSNRGGQTVQQCIDASTDAMLLSSAGPFAQAACSKRDVQRTGDGMVMDSTCTVGGRSATAHSVITGSFDSAYTMTITSHSDALPNYNLTMTLTGKWLGPCTAGQKPGDVVMPGGLKVNIRDLQKFGLGGGSPQLPPR